MLHAHATTLATARSHIAALADAAHTFDGAIEYEHALLYLDLIHGDDVPALDTNGLTSDRSLIHATAFAAVEALIAHGVDRLQVELLLDMLDVAWDRDNLEPDRGEI